MLNAALTLFLFFSRLNFCFNKYLFSASCKSYKVKYFYFLLIMEKKLSKKTQAARRSATPRKRLSNSEDDNTCVVCAQQIVIYAVGHCNHYICFKCSTKIRLLCEESLCPVCRKDMKKVIFTKKKKSFEELNSMKLIKDTDYDVGFFFYDPLIMKEYRRILEHKCPICHDRPPDRTFEQTKAHLRKEHTLFYCEICLEHNRTFTSECKVYSRKDLGIHKRVGDPDDSSHRGHPLCVYCDVRYLDDDKLFHHLRTTHFFCHLCDQGETNQFYGTYLDLREHFRREHFLCEEGNCINEEFTSVFATKLDFKAHCASVHRENRSKQQLKKERQIDLGFQYSRREQAASRGRGRGRGSDRPRSSRNGPRNDKSEFSNAFERESDLAKLSVVSHVKSNDPAFGNEEPTINNDDDAIENKPKTLFYQDDFPGLSNVNKQNNSIETIQQDQLQLNDKENSLPLWSKDANVRTSHFKTEEDFPLLATNQRPGISNVSNLWSNKTTKSQKKIADTSSSNNSQVKSNSMKMHQPNAAKQPFAKNFKNDQDFPVLTGSHSSSNDISTSSVNVTNTASVSKQANSSKSFKKIIKNNDEFPKLSDSNALPSAQWLIGGREIGNNVKGPKSVKSKPKSAANKQSNVSNNSSAKNSTNSNKKSSKSAKKVQKSEDLVKTNSSNEFVVGRGSSKHLEIFESFSDKTSPNISLITAEQKSKMEAPSKSKSIKFESDLNDFPSLSKVSAPPGFAGFTPSPLSLGDSLLTSTQNVSSPLTNIKPPPGFETKPSTSSSQKETNDFPLSSIYSPEEIGGPFNSLNEINQVPSEELESMRINKNERRFKKKKKEFRSKDLDSDFPSLPAEKASLPIFNNTNHLFAPPTQKIQSRPSPAGTDLNLANIFDS